MPFLDLKKDRQVMKYLVEHREGYLVVEDDSPCRRIAVLLKSLCGEWSATLFDSQKDADDYQPSFSMNVNGTDYSGPYTPDSRQTVPISGTIHPLDETAKRLVKCLTCQKELESLTAPKLNGEYFSLWCIYCGTMHEGYSIIHRIETTYVVQLIIQDVVTNIKKPKHFAKKSP